MEAVIEILNIAKEFTPAPGARNVDEGPYSGEEFLNKVLKPKFENALAEDFTILVDLDNTEGYATSFLEEAFGGLARMYGSEKVLNHLEFKSDDEPLLIDEIKMYIQEANP
jgi:hypothetical protein